MKRSPALAVMPSRPKTRGECAGVPRPCPFVGCRHHLAIDVSEDGALTVTGGRGVRLKSDPTAREVDRFVGAAVRRMDAGASCVLDVADRNPDGLTLEEVGGHLAVTRERIRQIETRALLMVGPRVRRRLGVEPGITPGPGTSVDVRVDS